MANGIGAHVVTTKRKYKGKTYRAHLLRRSYREGGKVKKETIANLTPLGDEVVELVKQALRGQKMAPVEDIFDDSRAGAGAQQQACDEQVLAHDDPSRDF